MYKVVQDEIGNWLLVATEQYQRNQPAVVVVFSLYGNSEGMSPKSALIWSAIDVGEAARAIRQSPIAEWGITALRARIDKDIKEGR